MEQSQRAPTILPGFTKKGLGTAVRVVGQASCHLHTWLRGEGSSLSTPHSQASCREHSATSDYHRDKDVMTCLGRGAPC